MTSFVANVIIELEAENEAEVQDLLTEMLDEALSTKEGMFFLINNVKPLEVEAVQ